MKKQITIIIQSRTKCKIQGLDEDHKKLFYHRFGIKHPAAHFHPKVKLGSWDGIIRFFKWNGDTYVNLLDEMIPSIVQWGYEVNLVHNYIFPTYNLPDDISIDANRFADKGITWPDSDKPVVAYEHQVRVANSLLKARYGIGDACTGAGKSLICALLADVASEYNLTTCIIVPSVDLVTQTSQDIKDMGIDVGQYGDGVQDIDHQTLVTTWQSLKHQPDLLRKMGMIIVDETHIDKNESIIQMLLEDYSESAAFVFGVTGTIPEEKLHQMTLELTIGKVVEVVSARELMDKGILSTVDIDVVKIDEDVTDMYKKYLKECEEEGQDPLKYKDYKQECFPDFQSEMKFVRNNKRRMNVVAELIQKDMERGNVFILVNNIQYGKQLAEMIDGAVFLYGANKTDERRKQYKRYQTETGLCTIANVQIASTGLNVPKIHYAYLIDLGKGFTRIIQTIGRALRKADGKKHATIRDIGSDLKYGKRHRTTRKRFYKKVDYPFKERGVKY